MCFQNFIVDYFKKGVYIYPYGLSGWGTEGG